jgi:peptide/nickel transport system substrate-binding protein
LRRITKTANAVTVLLGASLIAAACGSSKTDKGSSSTTAAVAATTTAAGTTTSGGGVTTTTAGGDNTGKTMTITIKLNPKAVWDDGTPITSKDIECTWKANLHTPASISTTGYDKITAVDTSDAATAVVSFKAVYAPYRNLFNAVIKAAAVKNCEDISGDFQDNIPFSGREWKLDSWSKDQEVLVPNTKFWDTTRTPKSKKLVMVPKADSDTELNSLKSAEVDFIFPQAFAGITDTLKDANIKYTPGYGTNYEGMYFQQNTGPFKDAAFRKGFSMSVDRNLILKSIYDPIFPGGPLLNCGLWVPTIGKWCDNTQFAKSYDPAAGEKALTAGGWAKNGDGMWAKGGTVPTIRWMINSGNKRREDTQALMIPEFKKAGFNVVPDNADAATVFQKRLPALDYDLAMYISTAQPDPTVTSIMACDQIPGPANNNQGQNNTGYCNQDASKLMAQSDAELDETKRLDEIHKIGQHLVDDAAMLPLYQFPNIAAWRTDKIDGPIDADAGNYRAFNNSTYTWTPKSGDQITVGAEQWPDCINPVTECANSSWELWTAVVPLLPAVWDTTAKGDYKITSLVASDPVVKIG